MQQIKLNEFANIIKSETDALNFLCEQKKKIKRISCPSCKSRRYYAMSKGRLRCKRCRADYNPFNDSWLDNVDVFDK